MIQYNDLESLILNTCNRIGYVDSFSKSPCENLLVSMYEAIEVEFKENYKLLKLINDFRIEKKQIKYMLRKTKKQRKESWKLSYVQLVENYKENSINMYDFNYQTMEELINTFMLFNERKKAIRFKRRNSKFNIFSRFRKNKEEVIFSSKDLS